MSMQMKFQGQQNNGNEMKTFWLQKKNVNWFLNDSTHSNLDRFYIIRARSLFTEMHSKRSNLLWYMSERHFNRDLYVI